jgi:hypothetical protein
MLRTLGVLLAGALLAMIFPLPSHCESLRQKYVGRSGCRPELRWATFSQGIRLDKTQKAYLKAYTVDHQNILLIVQYADIQDQCGVIRDAVQPRDAASGFIWFCADPKTPKNVVIGTWPSEHPKPSGLAVEAWRIDLGGLTFVPVLDRVECSAGGGPTGSDDGKDLLDWARKHSATRSTGHTEF